MVSLHSAADVMPEVYRGPYSIPRVSLKPERPSRRRPSGPVKEIATGFFYGLGLFFVAVLLLLVI